MEDVYVRPDVWTLDPDAEGSPWDERLLALAIGLVMGERSENQAYLERRRQRRA